MYREKNVMWASGKTWFTLITAITVTAGLLSPLKAAGRKLPGEPIAPVSALCHAHLADFFSDFFLIFFLLPFWLSATLLHMMLCVSNISWECSQRGCSQDTLRNHRITETELRGIHKDHQSPAPDPAQNPPGVCSLPQNCTSIVASLQPSASGGSLEPPAVPTCR